MCGIGPLTAASRQSGIILLAGPFIFLLLVLGHQNVKTAHSTVFIHINAPGAMHFSKRGGGATITYKKNQLSSPVAIGDNGHLQP